ncbi:hypothetical protein ACIQD3_12005 [Peribacillus loiseleuriae]|uniref:hypothetical protein n=1 Tax=Peribacillus loiseleuriae TaxID=1679170 RepID=UPI0038094694
MSGRSPITYILTALTALGGSFVLAVLLMMMKETTLMSGMIVGLLVGISLSVEISMNFRE